MPIVASDFQISGQSLLKENCRNSRTGDDLTWNMDKLTKIYRRNKTIARKLDDDVISDNCDIIVIFPIYGQFEQSGSRIPDAYSATF